MTKTSLVEVQRNRVRVLRSLAEKRCTVSELARRVGLNKSTIHGYLQAFVDEGLAVRHEDPERLWVYYSLTDLGVQVAANERILLQVNLDDRT